MKNLFVCIAALSLIACVEGKSKGSNPDLVADTSSAGSIFKAPEALPTTGSGGGGGGGGSVSLGNSSTVIADLSAGQRSDLCQKTMTAMTNALGGRTFSEVFCEINAITIAASITAQGDGDFQATCAEFSARCATQTTSENIECPLDDTNCEATVGEFEACLNSVLPQFTRLQELTCSNFDANSASQIDDSVFGEETPECKAFSKKCDFDDDDNNFNNFNNNDFDFNSFDNNEFNNNDFNNFGDERNNGDFGE